MLWLASLEEVEHIAPALDAAIGCRCPTSAQAEERLKGRHRLPPAVVPEYELIEVRLELGPTDAVVGANEPVLKIADDTIGEWHDRGGSLAERRPQRLLERDVPIPSRLQAGECRETVGVDRRAGGDVVFDDGVHGGRREIRQDDESDTTRTVITPL